MTFNINLVASILTFLVPIIDFILSRFSKDRDGNSNITYKRNNKIQINGHGNVFIQGKGNYVDNHSKVINLYPQRVTNSSTSSSIDEFEFVIAIISILLYITYTEYFILAALILNLILSILVIFIKQYIGQGLSVPLHIVIATSTMIILFLIQYTPFAPNGYIQFRNSFELNNIFHVIHLLMTGYTIQSLQLKFNAEFFGYMFVEVLCFAFMFMKCIHNIIDFSKPVIHNVTYRKMNFIARKIKLKSHAHFRADVNDYTKSLFIGSITSIFLLLFFPQLFELISKLFGLL